MVLSKLLLACLAVTANLANAEVVAGSTPLVKYSSCNKMQQNQIYEAWFDALKIANEGKGGFGDWKGDAEIEYFGPPALNHPYQRGIQDLLTRAAGLYRPWWFKPTLSRIRARCDDWENKCQQKGLAVYSSHGCTEGEAICINFCDGFFDLPSLNDVINTARPLKDDDIVKLHMATYQSRGSSMLHGLFHLQDVSWPIHRPTDRLVRFETHEGKTVMAPAIGPYWTKVVARVDLLNTNNTSGFPINTDNLVQYSVAKYIHKNLNVHPYYPIALSKTLGQNNETQGPGWEVIDGKLQGNGTLISGHMLSAVDTQPLEWNNDTIAPFDQVFNDPNYLSHVVLPLEKFIEHDRYPQTFFTGGRMETSPNGSPQLTPRSNYTKGDENLHCANEEITDEGYVTVQFAEESIDDACSKLKDIALGPKNTGIQNSYEFIDAEKQHSALWAGAFWNTGDVGCQTDRNVAEDECKEQLRECLNGCQVDTTSVKKGGSRVNNCIIYRLGVERNPTL
ncbi:hypothetical protein MferCBS31731_000030 [Microsporum ferrugineum]